MAKFKNIVGTGFESYVQGQITKRQELVSKQTRTPSDLQWLSNRTGWFRLSSGVDFNTNPQPNIKKTVTTLDVVGGGGLINDLTTTEEFLNLDGYSDSFAKQYILQSGIISTTDGTDTIIKKGFNETYTQGETDQLGYKPMPGITNITVGTGGKWQTLMQADIEFVCYDLDQLDIMTKLYMSLGMTVFLEWGHTPYIDNDGKLQKNIRPVNFFKYTDKDELLQAVTKKREVTFGNYDAVVGTVYNFDWKANNDGSYNCNLKVMGPGGMLESLKINGSTNIDFSKNDTDISSKKYTSTLGNALYSMKQYLEQREDLFTQKKDNKNIKTSFGKVTPNEFFKVTRYEVSTGKSSLFVSDIKKKIEGSWGGILSEIYSSATYNRINFTPIGDTGAEVTYINDDTTNILANPSKVGNAHQLLKGINVPNNDNLGPITTDFYSGYVSKLQIDDGEKLISSYITFGHLMALIQHISVFTESKEAINISTSSPDTSTCKPVVYIDYHPDNTIIQRGPLECSIDPTKCIIPFNLDTTKGQTLNDIFDPLDTLDEGAYSFWKGIDKPNNYSRNLLINPDKNKVNPLAPQYEGKLFNILINLEYAHKTLKELADNKDKEVNLLEYVNTILDGINLSLGKINNLRTFVGDDGKTLRIVDEEPVEPITSENLLTIPNFGLNSIAYDYGFSSKITPKLATQIVIANQARDTNGVKQFSDDVLSYQSMNINIIDRFSKTKLPPIIKKTTDGDEKTGKTLKTQQKLFDHIYYCYSGDENANIGLKTESLDDLINPFSDLMGKRKKTSKLTGTPLIPLEFNMTIDGMSGILPYNAFLIPNNRLPKKYRGKIAFIIFSINHGLSGNKWTTTLRGQVINLDNPVYTPDTTTISGTGEPATSPNSTLVGIDFPEEKLIASEVTIGSSNISNSKYNPKRLPPSDTTTISNQTPTEPGIQTNSTPDLDILAAVPFIKNQEGFEPQPYPDPKDDPNGRLSIGYGSDTITRPDGSFYKITRKSRVTEQDAERDLIRRIKTEFRPRVIQRLRDRGVEYNTVDTKIQVVFIDLAYNYGTLFYDFVEAYKTNGKQGVIGELNNRIARFDRGERGQVKTRRIAEKRYLGG